MPSLKELRDKQQVTEIDDKQPAQQNTAAAILMSHSIKDRRMSFRISSSLYARFTEINTKLGASNGSVLNTLISQYIREHSDLL